MTRTLGTITLSRHGRQVVASLHDDLRWECDDQLVRDVLQTHFSPAEISVADGQRGRALLHKAAEHLEGTAAWLAGDPVSSPVDVIH